MSQLRRNPAEIVQSITTKKEPISDNDFEILKKYKNELEDQSKNASIPALRGYYDKTLFKINITMARYYLLNQQSYDKATECFQAAKTLAQAAFNIIDHPEIMNLFITGNKKILIDRINEIQNVVEKQERPFYENKSFRRGN